MSQAIINILKGDGVKLSGSKTGNCVSASVTRLNDTTAYAVGDVVGNTTYLEFADVGVAGQEICIYDITLMIKKAGAALAAAAGASAYKVYLYTDAPTAIADNAAWTLGIADADKYARIVAQTGAVSDRGDVLVATAEAINRFVKLTGTSLYAYLVTDSAYTPVALTVQDLELHYSAI